MPKLHRDCTAAARLASSSSAIAYLVALVPDVDGRREAGWYGFANEVPIGGRWRGREDDDGADWYDREKLEPLWLCLFDFPIPYPSCPYACSFMGGGVVSVELMSSSWSSEVPEAVGEADDWSLSTILGASDGGEGSGFIPTRTDAASSSCTC